MSFQLREWDLIPAKYKLYKSGQFPVILQMYEKECYIFLDRSLSASIYGIKGYTGTTSNFNISSVLLFCQPVCGIY